MNEKDLSSLSSASDSIAGCNSSNRRKLKDCVYESSRRKQRKELNDCFFVYALEQTGLYDEATLNAIRLRIQHRYLSSSAINTLYEEFGIHIKVNCIDEESKGKN